MLPYALSTDPRYRDHVQRAHALRAQHIASLLRAARARAGRAIAAYRQWRQRRQAIMELNTLDDRMLKDMSLSRSQIYGVVYGIDDPRPLRPATRNVEAAKGMSVKDCIDAAVAGGQLEAGRGAQAKRLLDEIEADCVDRLGPGAGLRAA